MTATLDLAGYPRPSDPAHHAAVVTPNDNNDLPHVTTGLWIVGTTGGTLQVTMAGGETVTFSGLTQTFGVILPLRVSRVWATNTNVTVIALWR